MLIGQVQRLSGQGDSLRAALEGAVLANDIPNDLSRHFVICMTKLFVDVQAAMISQDAKMFKRAEKSYSAGLRRKC